MHDERTHHYHYDSQHRLVFYTRIQHGEPLVESRYLYDPLGRRTGKRVWRRCLLYTSSLYAGASGTR